MRASGAAGSRFRARKLNTKTALPILREADVEGGSATSNGISAGSHQHLKDAQHAAANGLADGEAGLLANGDPLGGSLPKVESGVESKEEREHHLQQVIHASQAAATGGKVAQISIPTPDARRSDVDYDKLYSRVFVQPATYIRSSSTVEDSTGVAYCMNDDDDVWLRKFNAKRGAAACSEDEFEELMSSFEETTALRQPFAAVDHTPVLILDELEAAFDEMVSDGARRFAREVYEYWKDRRARNDNRSLMPKLKTLKMETGQEADDSDPYVCFRRREVRQARKTRGRDAQVVEKLKKLRRELEEARQLVHMVKEREMLRKSELQVSRSIFEKRTNVREMKRALNIQDDDEDLITQRPKRRATADANAATPQQLPSGARHPSHPGRTGGLPRPGEIGVQASDSEIAFLRDQQIKQEREVARQIQKKIEQHEEWNTRHIDFTEAILRGFLEPGDVFLAPEQRQNIGAEFVAVRSEDRGGMQLPTPPPSNPATSDDEAEQSTEWPGLYRAEKSTDKDAFMNDAHIRLRGGRNGRIFIDRHNLKFQDKPFAANERLADRYKYDHDDGDADSDEEHNALWEQRQFRMRTRWLHEEREREILNDQKARDRLAQRRAPGHAPQPQAQPRKA